MKINLAIYTAKEGYSWQSGKNISQKSLIEYKQIIGRFPDPTVDILPFGGAFLCKNKAVFYRFHIAKQADSKGRDALYVVLGEVDKELACKINFQTLFMQSEFALTANIYPDEMNYIGGTAKTSGLDFSKSFSKNYLQTEDLTIIGDILSNADGDNLTIKIAGNYTSPMISINYKVPVTVAAQVKTDMLSSINLNKAKKTTADIDLSDIKSSIPKYDIEPIMPEHNNSIILVISMTIFALIIGFVAGYFAGKNNNKITTNKPKVEIKTINENNKKLTLPPQERVLEQPAEKPMPKPLKPVEKPKNPYINKQVQPSNIPNQDNIKKKQCPNCIYDEVACRCERMTRDRQFICTECNGSGWIPRVRYCQECKLKKIKEELQRRIEQEKQRDISSKQDMQNENIDNNKNETINNIDGELKTLQESVPEAKTEINSDKIQNQDKQKVLDDKMEK